MSAAKYIPPKAIITGIQFGLLSDSTITKYSTCEIQNHQMHAMKVVKCSSILAPSMGTTDGFMLCSTCNQDYKSCSHHIGHLNLAVPLFNHETLLTLKKILQVTCFYCCHSLLGADPKKMKRILGMASKKRRLAFMVKACSKLRTCGQNIAPAAATTTVVVEQQHQQKQQQGELRPEQSFLGRCGARQPLFQTDGLVLRARFILNREDIARGVSALPIFDTTTLHRWLSLIPSGQLPFLGEQVRPESLLFSTWTISPPGVRPPITQAEGSHTYGHDDASLHIKEITKVNLQVRKYQEEHPAERASLAIYEFEGFESSDGAAIVAYGQRRLLLEAEAAEEQALKDATDKGGGGGEEDGGGVKKRRRVVGGKVSGGGTSKKKLKVVPLPLVSVPRAAPGGGFRPKAARRLTDIVHDLQVLVGLSQNNKLAKKWMKFHAHGKKLKGLRQKTDGKTGRARGDIFGKRAGLCARAVVTPNTHLGVEEVGVPRVFAKNLTRRERILPWNIRHWTNVLRQGGVDYILSEGEEQTRRIRTSRRVTTVLEVGTTIERHLRTGDDMPILRHPCLWKNSINSHKTVLVDGHHIEVHPSATPMYNADYDGDEFNLASVDSQTARAEARYILCFGNQIVSSHDGSALASFVQDAVIAQALLTGQHVFAQRLLAMQILCYSKAQHCPDAASLAIVLPRPCVQVRDPVTGFRQAWWSGKQLWSCLLPQTYILVRGIPPERWTLPSSAPPGTSREQVLKLERSLCIMNGQILYGTVDKDHCGNVADGIIHTLWLDFGTVVTCRFINQMQRMANFCLQSLVPVSIGSTDSRPPVLCAELAQSLLQKGLAFVNQEETAEFRDHTPDTGDAEQERLIRSVLEKIRDVSMHYLVEQLKKESRGNCMLRNGFFEIVNNKSKGTAIDLTQCMLMLGQQNLKSQRIANKFPTLVQTHSERHGFVSNNYRQGLTAEQYWYTSYGGIEGVVATAVKSSATGYIQRRLETGMQDNVVQGDGTVRNSHLQVVRTCYGDDNYDGQYVQKVQLRCLAWSNEELRTAFTLLPDTEFTLTAEARARQVEECVTYAYASDYQDHELTQVIRLRDSLREAFLKLQVDSGLPSKVSSPVGFGRLLDVVRYTAAYHTPSVDCGMDVTPFELHCSLRYFLQTLCEEQLLRTPNEEGGNWCFLLVFSEYYSLRNLTRLRITAKGLSWLLAATRLRLRKALVVTGESVGTLAGSHIGQPTTQMNMNMHKVVGRVCNLAGGIPRMGEIIDGKKMESQKTPSDTYYLRTDFLPTDGSFTDEETYAKVLASRMCGPLLSELVLASHMLPAAVVVPPLIVVGGGGEKEGGGAGSANTPPPPPTTALAFCLLASEDYRQLAPFMIRMTLHRSECAQRGIGPLMVAQELSKYLGEEHAITHSEPHDAQWLIYVRLSMASVLWQSLIKGKVIDGHQTSASFITRTVEKRLLETIRVGGVERITNAYVDQCSSSEVEPLTGSIITTSRWIIRTQGSNFAQILAWPEVDALRSCTNELHSRLAVLGIASTRRSIQREVYLVFDRTGMSISSRHLKQMAATMCFRGKISPFTRHGMCGEHKSPWHNIGYEKSTEHLMDAVLCGSYDPMAGISEAVVANILAPVGTGTVDIVLWSPPLSYPNSDASPPRLVSELILKPTPEVWRANDIRTRGIRSIAPSHSKEMQRLVKEEIPVRCTLQPTYSLSDLNLDCYLRPPKRGERRFEIMACPTSGFFPL